MLEWIIISAIVIAAAAGLHWFYSGVFDGLFTDRSDFDPYGMPIIHDEQVPPMPKTKPPLDDSHCGCNVKLEGYQPQQDGPINPPTVNDEMFLGVDLADPKGDRTCEAVFDAKGKIAYINENPFGPLRDRDIMEFRNHYLCDPVQEILPEPHKCKHCGKIFSDQSVSGCIRCDNRLRNISVKPDPIVHRPSSIGNPA